MARNAVQTYLYQMHSLTRNMNASQALLDIVGILIDLTINIIHSHCSYQGDSDIIKSMAGDQ